MNFAELEQAINKLKLEPLGLQQGQYIENPLKFVESHMSTLKNNPGDKRYKPYYDRLLNYYQLLKTKQDDRLELNNPI